MDLKYIPPTIGLNLGEIVTDKIRLNFFDLGEEFNWFWIIGSLKKDFLGGQRELQHLWKKVWDGLTVLNQEI